MKFAFAEDQSVITAPVRMPDRALTRRSRLAAELLAVIYVAAVTQVAAVTGIPYLLFPELGALVYDVLIRPWGKWASQPIRLILTPAITAVVGTLVTRHLPFNTLSVVLIVSASVIVIAALKSNIAPAMSAGVLPLVLGVKSWMYPPSILITLSVLSAISIVWRKYHSRSIEPASDDVEDILESPPRGRLWLLVFMGFVIAAAEAAHVSGLRFIIFPPLVTMAYEMFGHPETCPWTKRPISLPVSCFVVALSGFLAYRAFGPGIVMATVSMVISIAVLRFFDLHMPPALAVGLLPAVMDSPNFKFPFAVLAGTLGLTGAFLLYRKMQNRNLIIFKSDRPFAE